MDDFHAQAIKRVRERHEKKIRQIAEEIQEHIGFVLDRLDKDASSSVGHYAAGIATDADEIINRLAILEGMTDATGIFEATDEIEG